MNEGECDIGCTQTQHKIALNRPCPPNPLQREILCRPLTSLMYLQFCICGHIADESPLTLNLSLMRTIYMALKIVI